MKYILTYLASWSCLFYSCSTISSDENIAHEDYSVKEVLQASEDHYNVAFLISEGVYNTELTAPFDIFHHTKFRNLQKPMKVFTVSEKKGLITTFEGLKIQVDYSFSQIPENTIDILVVPSAEHHLDSDLENEVLIDFVRNTANSCEWVISLCDGAFILAEAGLLDSVVSTTFPGDLVLYKNRYPLLKVDMESIFVQDGKFITSAGGAKSFQPAIFLLEILYGKNVAIETAKGMVIDWDLSELDYFSQIINDSIPLPLHAHSSSDP